MVIQIKNNVKEIKSLKMWEKLTKNPKYCKHVIGYWSSADGKVLKCITCGKPYEELRRNGRRKSSKVQT